MIKFCSICGDELETPEEIERGFCIDCDCIVLHDFHEIHQLF